MEILHKFVPAHIYVIKKTKRRVENILGAKASQELGILKIQAQLHSINKHDNTEESEILSNQKLEEVKVSDEISKLIEEYSDIFTGMGRMKDVLVSLPIDKNVKSVSQKHRRIPFHMRTKVN